MNAYTVEFSVGRTISKMEWDGGRMRRASVRRPVYCERIYFHPFWQNDSHTHNTGITCNLRWAWIYVYIFYEMIVRNQFPVGWGIKFTESEWAMCVYVRWFSHVQTRTCTNGSNFQKLRLALCCHAASLFKWQFFWRECGVCGRGRARELFDKYKMLLSIFRSFCVNQNKLKHCGCVHNHQFWDSVVSL